MKSIRLFLADENLRQNGFASTRNTKMKNQWKQFKMEKSSLCLIWPHEKQVKHSAIRSYFEIEILFSV